MLRTRSTLNTNIKQSLAPDFYDCFRLLLLSLMVLAVTVLHLTSREPIRFFVINTQINCTRCSRLRGRGMGDRPCAESQLIPSCGSVLLFGACIVTSSLLAHFRRRI